MKTIYRKVLVSERLPEKVSQRYFTNKGLTYLWEGQQWFEDNIEYWLEEIELMDNEKIETEFSSEPMKSENDDATRHKNDVLYGKREGAKWMRDFVLAVTPINTKTNGA